MSGGRKKRLKQSRNKQEIRMANLLTDAAAFEEFRKNILPSVQEDLKNKLSVDQIYAKYANLAAARTVTIVATEPSAGVALAAIKEMLDRTGGKAIEKKQIEHRLGKLPDQELDALLLTELSEGETDESNDDQED